MAHSRSAGSGLSPEFSEGPKSGQSPNSDPAPSQRRAAGLRVLVFPARGGTMQVSRAKHACNSGNTMLRHARMFAHGSHGGAYPMIRACRESLDNVDMHSACACVSHASRCEGHAWTWGNTYCTTAACTVYFTEAMIG
jgi:hypothetical protein